MPIYPKLTARLSGHFSFFIRHDRAFLGYLKKPGRVLYVGEKTLLLG
ncbi:MAG: hypothetical protein ACRCT1_19580 [Microcoleaceae cyanobacterium]